MSQKLYIYSMLERGSKGDREFTSTGKGLGWFCFVVEKGEKEKKIKGKKDRKEMR